MKSLHDCLFQMDIGKALGAWVMPIKLMKAWPNNYIGDRISSQFALNAQKILNTDGE
jgi:hypothetical protein